MGIIKRTKAINFIDIWVVKGMFFKITSYSCQFFVGFYSDTANIVIFLFKQKLNHNIKNGTL